MPIIVRTAFNNAGWQNPCTNVANDERLFQCRKNIINVRITTSNTGSCKAKCWEQSLCSDFVWDSYPRERFGERAAGRAYFIHKDIDGGLVLWGKSTVAGVNNNKIHFRRFRPLPSKDQVKGLSYQRLEELGAPNWGNGTFRYILEETADILDSLISKTEIIPTEPAEEFWSIEGRKLLRQHVRSERSPQLVKEFKAQLKTFSCSACEFSFESTYGRLGANFIEAHHTTPIASLTEGTKVSISDLRPVCSNCHRMLHRENPPMTIEQLKKLIQKHRQ